MISRPPQCLKCKHYKEIPEDHWFICTAFPEGIPTEIVYGRVDHHYKFPGDKGIRFEPRMKKKSEDLENKVEKSAVPYLDFYLEKSWWEWSKWRKPKYDPANKKSVSACKKFAQMGIYKPGCARAIHLAENVYEPGKDDNAYVPPQQVDPIKLFSKRKEEREAEMEKKRSLETMDLVFNDAYFYRDPQGRIIILNWASLTPDEKKLLSNMFDESGVLKETKHREFDKRFEDFNSRRLKHGMQEKNIA